MKKLYTLVLSTVVTVAAMAQSTANLPILNKTPRTPNSIPQKPVAPLATSTFIIDYDSADAVAQQNTFGFGFQRFIWDFNYNYNVPADTGLKYFVIAFDSLYDSYMQVGYNRATVNNVRIDSIHMILGQENNSGVDDTITYKIVSVNANGYPGTTVLWTYDYIIPATSPFGTNWLQPVLLSIPCGYTTASNVDRFALRVEYHGNKLDTCGWIAGFGNQGQSGTCNIAANRTEYSPYKMTNGQPYNANTFTVWTQYLSYGTLPNAAGANIYYDCNGSGQYEPGAGDGENYLQDISVFVQVTTDPLSIKETNLDFSISQNVPNPFNGNTMINYELKNNSTVALTVFDITGAVVKNIQLGKQLSGKHNVTIDGTDLTAGIYFYTFNVNGSTITRKMTVIK
jgi:hypothetical protein